MILVRFQGIVIQVSGLLGLQDRKAWCATVHGVTRVGHDWVNEKQHLLMSMCRVVSCVVGIGCLIWPVHSLGKTLLAFALLHYVLQGQTCLLFQVSLDFLLLHSSPLCWKGHLFFFGVSSRRSCKRRQWHPTPVLLPGNSHGRRSLVGCSPWGREESDTTEGLHFHFSLSCIGEGNRNPLQCSFLENPRDRGAW